jgi:hypothetical protein
VESIGSDILLKITQHSRFAKYTLWLMTDKTAPQAGQIAPALAHIGPESTDQTAPRNKLVNFINITFSLSVIRMEINAGGLSYVD